jgi:UDP-glucose 4-epimerase
LRDAELLKTTFRENEIEAVIHMAAYSLVGESVGNPAKYYENNVVAGLSLLDAMVETEVKKLVFLRPPLFTASRKNSRLKKKTDLRRRILMERRNSLLNTRYAGMKTLTVAIC